jgi:acetyl-CoA synthetase
VAVIHKNPQDWQVPPNLLDYDAVRAQFDWAAVPNLCAELGDEVCNLGYAAVDRHANGALRNHIALRFVDASEPDASVLTQEWSYGDLAALVMRFTNVLRRLGFRKGSRVFTVLGRSPELYISVLGALRNGSVVSPMFAAFGPEPLATRLVIGEADVLITTRALYLRKIAKIRSSLPSLSQVIIVDHSEEDGVDGTVDFWRSMNSVADDAPVELTSANDPALVHFTSGTTGTPKGAVHVHGALATHYLTGLYALDLHPNDIYWCTADPGWVTGMSYGVISPLLLGVTSIVDEDDFDVERWYRILESQHVSVWYTAPTAIRMLIKAGPKVASRYDFRHLRFVASVGEPLSADAVQWGSEVLGRPIHDNWWQTETGGIMIANTPAFDIKPGSMGRPLPGIYAYVVRRSRDGNISIIAEPEVEGELALRQGWPSMFRGYLHEDQKYQRCFHENLYLTGDIVKRDVDGYFWFVGRSDDVIKSAGHLIGPFEVENALTDHPAIAEAAVIGIPDPTAGETVKAFVTVRDGYPPDEKLRADLLAHARRRLGSAIAPKQIEFVDALPHTRSGKIVRRLLRAQELGMPSGDTSSLEPSAGSDMSVHNS